MAWHSDAYVGLSYTGGGYTAIFDFELAGGIYQASGYVGVSYTGISYTVRQTDTTISFNLGGTAADVDVQGNVAGLPFSEQGAAAAVGVAAYWSGFAPDPGGILENDSDPDGDPLSYTVVDQPEGGTLSAYAGGAFEWDPGAAPVGRYSWTYRLYAGGEASDDLGVVTIEYGDLFAKAGVSGFAGDFGFGFNEQGTLASVLVTGFAGELLLTFDKQGTAAAVACQGHAGSIATGFTQRGTAAQCGVSGFAGDLVGTFTQQGTAAAVACEGFAGTLDTGVFFSAQGTAAQVGAQGFAGELDSGGFQQQGTGAVVIPFGVAGNIRSGLSAQGTAAQVDAEGNEPLTADPTAKVTRIRASEPVLVRVSGDSTAIKVR